MAEASNQEQIKHLNPSKLGTKEFWDQSYQNDLENAIGQEESTDLTKLESWFDICDAPARVLQYLTSDEFPLSPNNPDRTVEKPTVIDLGCGNGSSLFELKLEGEYPGQMIGVDYSEGSVNLSRRLWSSHVERQNEDGADQIQDITFETFDLMHEQAVNQSWWQEGGFDLVLDKGTFDAICLSDATTTLDDKTVRICEAYPGIAAKLVKSGGYLLITSCNWTEAEVIRWFTEGPGVKGILQVYGKVRYPVYQFGGRQGQSVASVCFQKV